jgi:hypothetical protein
MLTEERNAALQHNARLQQELVCSALQLKISDLILDSVTCIVHESGRIAYTTLKDPGSRPRKEIATGC